MRRRLLALVALLCTALPSVAAAETIKLCFLTTADMSDSGFPLSDGTKEDHWLASQDRPIRGAKFELRVSGVIIAQGYLDDGLGSGGGKGCTSTITRSDVDVTYDVKIWAKTKVNKNTIKGVNGAKDGSGCFRTFRWTNDEGSGTYDVHFHGVSESCDAVWRAVNVGSYALYRHRGGLSDKTFTVRVGPKCEEGENQFAGKCCNGNNGSADLLCLTPHRRKFTTVHEFGHSLAGKRDGDLLRGGQCGDDDDSCPSDEGQDDSVAHAMGSREYQVCAFQEAFAHFYAADVWNDHGEQDCVYRYYKEARNADGEEVGKPTIDCEAAGDASDDTVVGGRDDFDEFHGFKIPYMERVCDTPHEKRGAEVDWLRALWDVHGNHGRENTGGGVSFTTMMEWMSSAIDGWDDKIDEELTNKADEMGGKLKANWLGGGEQGAGARQRYGTAH